MVQSTAQLSHCSPLSPATPVSQSAQVLELRERERMVASKSKQVFDITPHKRRGPIAAEFSTPGPASIALPGLFGSKNSIQITQSSVEYFDTFTDNFQPQPIMSQPGISHDVILSDIDKLGVESRTCQFVSIGHWTT